MSEGYLRVCYLIIVCYPDNDDSVQVMHASVTSASLISLFQQFVGSDVILTLTLSDIVTRGPQNCENESLHLAVKRSDVL